MKRRAPPPRGTQVGSDYILPFLWFLSFLSFLLFVRVHSLTRVHIDGKCTQAAVTRARRKAAAAAAREPITLTLTLNTLLRALSEMDDDNDAYALFEPT
jgi:hypothetical protein